MDIKNQVLIKLDEENIGLFQKIIEMPEVPPKGTSVTFGKGIHTVSCNVSAISYNEEEGVYSAHYVIDLGERRNHLKDYISEEYYPKNLVNHCGFKVCWLEESYEKIAEKLNI